MKAKNINENDYLVQGSSLINGFTPFVDGEASGAANG
jgi:hypothetical protein